jgi:glycosyltransferase involved in cell wall biosynthesis
MRPETTHPELIILMPCLNEAETIATCMKKASSYLSKSNIRGEILVADYGSTDGSREIAQGLGARVEAWYPHKSAITAVGIDDASLLAELYPRIRYLRANGLELPFSSLAFDKLC